MLSIKIFKIIAAVTLTTLIMEIHNPIPASAQTQVTKTNSVVVVPKKRNTKIFNVFKIFQQPKRSRISR